jgi:uncharacterized protein (TIGR02391 family)
LDQISKSLLEKILNDSMANSKGINAIKFRAKHYEHLDLLDSLESTGYLENRLGNYYLKLLAFLELSDSVNEVEELFNRWENLFQVLRQYYLEHPGESISINDLTEISNIKRDDINICLIYMVQAPIFNSYSINFIKFEAEQVTPSERILKYQNFRGILEEMRSLKSNRSLEEDVKWENVEDFRFLLHTIITEHAWPQYNNGHLRDAVLNSIIAVFDMIRQKTGLKEDGDKLIGKAFSLDDPYLILSDIDTESGQNDQKGFMQILKGSFQSIRNPKAHSLVNDLNKLKTAQYLVFGSLLARRIDEAKVIKREQT